jgi:hypothetical protein
MKWRIAHPYPWRQVIRHFRASGPSFFTLARAAASRDNIEFLAVTRIRKLQRTSGYKQDTVPLNLVPSCARYFAYAPDDR